MQKSEFDALTRREARTKNQGTFRIGGDSTPMLDATVDTFRSTLEFAVESQKCKEEIFVAVPAVGADAVVKIQTSFLKAMLESNQESEIIWGVIKAIKALKGDQAGNEEAVVLLVAELTSEGEGISSDTQITGTPDATIPFYLPESKSILLVGPKFKAILDAHERKPSLLVSAHVKPIRIAEGKSAFAIKGTCERTPVTDPKRQAALMKESLNIIEEYLRSKAKPLRGLFGKFGQGGGR